jgi:hypothetical protein
LARSMPALGMLMAFESIYIIILSTAVHMVERGQYCAEVCPGDCDGYCFGTATKGQGWYAIVSDPHAHMIYTSMHLIIPLGQIRKICKQT